MTSQVHSEILSPKCQSVQILGESLLYKIILVLKAFANIGACMFFVFLISTKPRLKIFHPNTKVISSAVILFVLLQAFSCGIFYLLELWRVTYPYSNVCDRLWNTPLLFCVRIAYVVTINGINSSLIALSIERLICIRRINSYEKSSKPVCVAVLLMTMTVIFTVTFSVLYMPGVEWDDGTVITSLRNAKNAGNYQISLIYMMIVELSSVFLFVFIHFWCLSYRKRIRGFKFVSERSDVARIAKYKSLSVKFQTEETLRMTKVFLPVVVVKFSINVFNNFTATVSNLVWRPSTIDMQMVMFEALTITTCQPFFLAIVFAYYTGRISSVCGLFRRKIQSDHSLALPANGNQDEHFNQLKQMFEGTARVVKLQKEPKINWIRHLRQLNRIGHRANY
ncbi:serpentine type 7TM GPCR receptor class ab chemoreceptor domain-containing protein [Ditylenchus destructor]|uniref:Serpentine type 7TM GPCR receptor class ab chemoreceptor domain-containing protein n=1 Tax=Ditylenchus destructor TaxID=166010 RepID=A0AAD4QWE5_9BILA|nr:serpentine type 7TM GPCR receptor class ab chemoreceptor domain-containing protein [Ditylenchus destructor]